MAGELLYRLGVDSAVLEITGADAWLVQGERGTTPLGAAVYHSGLAALTDAPTWTELGGARVLEGATRLAVGQWPEVHALLWDEPRASGSCAGDRVEVRDAAGQGLAWLPADFDGPLPPQAAALVCTAEGAADGAPTPPAEGLALSPGAEGWLWVRAAGPGGEALPVRVQATLYSALHKLNGPDTNIITVEDPVEYELFGVNQVQVRSEIGLTFAAGLRSILRQDPDVIMVGEIRDEETADIAIKAALTGHLVLSTLHTNDAASVFTRLVDMGMEPFLVQSSVGLAAAQRLLRRVCPDCKEPIRVPEEVLERIQFKHSPGAPPPSFVRGRGCTKCKDTGYRGRLAVIEAMPNYPDLQDLIMTRAPAAEIKRAAIQCGMATLRQNALKKAAEGITTIEEVLRVSAAD